MSYWDYEDFYEPSEFDELVEEFKDGLRKSVKEEFQQELEKLKKENEQLREVKANWNKLQAEYENKNRELECKIYECKSNAARMRLEELFEHCDMSMILFKPGSNSVYLPKCSRCDDERYIHYKTPSGKDAKELCDCARSYIKFKPTAYYCTEFRMNRRTDDKNKYPLMMWYKRYRDYGSDYGGYEFDTSSICRFVFNGESFDEIAKEHGQNAFFRDEQKCQEYCDYLNEINGITDEMA